MALSLSERHEDRCPNCGEKFKAKTWFAVDATEHPELWDACRLGEINTVTCPSGHSWQAELPVIVHNSAIPLLLLATARPVMSPEESSSFAHFIDRLLQLVPEDDAGYVAGPVVAWLPNVPKILARKSLAEMREEEERVQDEEAALPEAVALLDERLSALPPLQREALLGAIAGARTPEEMRRAIDRNPGLARAAEMLAAGPGRISEDYGDLERILERLDGEEEPSAEEKRDLLTRALRLTPRRDEPELWARLQHGLGDALRWEEPPDPAGAIACYTAALEIVDRKSEPLWWSSLHADLGEAYFEWPDEDGLNVETSIMEFRQALTDRSREEDQDSWGALHHQLGLALMRRVTGKRRRNLSEAIRHLETATKALSREGMPVRWGLVRGDLADAYFERAEDGDYESLDHAIELWETAIPAVPQERLPDDVVHMRRLLGMAHLVRSRGLDLTHLDAAVELLQEVVADKAMRGYPDELAGSRRALKAARDARRLAKHILSSGPSLLEADDV